MQRAGGAWTIGGGTARGANLFHSFSDFGLPTGQSATFGGSAANVIARVTGGNASVIDGPLAASGSLWLINPAGVTLNANATLSLGGSFHASTANYLRLADGGVFHASLSAASTLTSAAPSAFGFLGPAAPLTVNGSQLTLDPLKNLSLVGGTLTLDAASLRANGGDVTLAAVASAGELDLASASWSGTGPLAPLSLSNVQIITAYDRGGRIALRGGDVTVLAPDFEADTGGYGAPGRGISIEASGRFVLGGGGYRQYNGIFSDAFGGAAAGAVSIRADEAIITDAAYINTDSQWAGRGGDVTVVARNITLTGNAEIDARALSKGRAGTVRLLASERVTLSGGDTLINADTGYAHRHKITGRGGSIVISGSEVLITDSANLSARSVSLGQGGDISVTATGDIVVENFAGLTTGSDHGGASGNMILSGRNVTVRDSGGLVSTSDGTGLGGKVSITAQDGVTFSGGAYVNIDTKGPGKGGEVIVIAGGLFDLRGRILSGAQAPVTGDAGSVTVNAGTLSVSEGGAISTQTIGAGKAGDIGVTAGVVDVGRGGTIESATTGAGAAGTISLAGGHVSVHDGGSVNASSTGAGLAGRILVNATKASIAGGLLSTKTSGSGNAGDVEVVAGALDLAGGRIESSSSGSGNGGSIAVSAGEAKLHGGAEISVSSTGTGTAGSITLDAGRQLIMSETSRISATTASANAGDITVRAAELVQVKDSEITTSVAGGTGGGGNIVIDPTFVVLDSGRVVAQAQEGAGGRITIASDFFLAQGDWLVDASSLGGGISGVVAITAPKVDLNSSLLVLASNFLVAHRLSETCAARASRGSSSFIAAGRGGLPALDLMAYTRAAPKASAALISPRCPST